MVTERVRSAVLDATVAASGDALARSFCRAVEGPTTALARVWLSEQFGDLKLTVSAGQPIGGGSYHQIDGTWARVRGGSSKIARIASTGEALIVRGLRGDEPWLENPAWIARQGIRSFVGLPIAAGGEVLGVMVLFDRSLTSDETIDGLHFLSEVVAVRWRQLRVVVTSPISSRSDAAPVGSLVTRHELRAIEKQSIQLALERSQGRIFGASGAAALLAMKPTTLASRIKTLGIKP